MRSLGFLLCFLTIVATGWSQNRGRNAVPSFSPVPGVAARHESALGKRVRAKGKEQTMYIGEVIDSAGKRSPARIQHQLPILIRADGFRPGRPLSFDGERTTGVLNKSDERLLEAFTLNTAEGMFALIRNGAALRHLGNGFGPDPRSAPNYAGPRLDIFQVNGTVPFSVDTSAQPRVFYFDSDTGLLQRTRSSDSETRYSAWKTIEG
jgi:hypothetical protein